MIVTTRTTSAILRATAIAFGIAAVMAVADRDQVSSQSRSPLEIRTLSSRADLVSGGDALIAVKVPAGTRADQLTVALNGKDLTRLSFDAASSEYRGVIDGLAIGTNRVTA